jgi:hypothetical protein
MRAISTPALAPDALSFFLVPDDLQNYCRDNAGKGKANDNASEIFNKKFNHDESPPVSVLREDRAAQRLVHAFCGTKQKVYEPDCQ